MKKIIIKPSDVPKNTKLTNITIITEDGERYKIILGLRYFYLIDYQASTCHKVKQSITLLNLFTEALSNNQQAREELVKTLSSISIEEHKQSFINSFINQLK